MPSQNYFAGWLEGLVCSTLAPCAGALPLLAQLLVYSCCPSSLLAACTPLSHHGGLAGWLVFGRLLVAAKLVLGVLGKLVFLLDFGVVR